MTSVEEEKKFLLRVCYEYENISKEVLKQIKNIPILKNEISKLKNENKNLKNENKKLQKKLLRLETMNLSRTFRHFVGDRLVYDTDGYTSKLTIKDIYKVFKHWWSGRMCQRPPTLKNLEDYFSPHSHHPSPYYPFKMKLCDEFRDELSSEDYL